MRWIKPITSFINRDIARTRLQSQVVRFGGFNSDAPGRLPRAALDDIKNTRAKLASAKLINRRVTGMSEYATTLYKKPENVSLGGDIGLCELPPRA